MELAWRSGSVMDYHYDDPGFDSWWEQCIYRA